VATLSHEITAFCLGFTVGDLKIFSDDWSCSLLCISISDGNGEIACHPCKFMDIYNLKLKELISVP